MKLRRPEGIDHASAVGVMSPPLDQLSPVIVGDWKGDIQLKKRSAGPVGVGSRALRSNIKI